MSATLLAGTDGAAAAPALVSDATSGRDRRDFLQRVVTGGVLVAGTGLLAGCASMGAAAAVPARGALGDGVAPAPRTGLPSAPAGSPWDMSWMLRLGRYRTAYDSPEIESGAALHFAVASTSGYRAAFGAADAEITPVLILRHTASVMTLDDAMWQRVGAGERWKVNDPRTGAPAVRNPFIGYRPGDERSMIGAAAGVDTLVARGAIVLTCNNALMGVAYVLRQQETALTQEQAMAEVRRAVLPGVYVMPNGIFAVSAAQDAGCHYMRVLV